MTKALLPFARAGLHAMALTCAVLLVPVALLRWLALRSAPQD